MNSRELTAYVLIVAMLVAVAVAIFFVRRNSWQAVAARGRKADLKRSRKRLEQVASVSSAVASGARTPADASPVTGS